MQAIFLTTDELLDEWWDKAIHHLIPVVKEAARGEFEIDDLLKLCRAKLATCGVAIDQGSVVMVMVFEFIHYPKISACNVIALGGSHLSEVSSLFFVTFKEWCKSIGVTVIEASCSSAMSRLLKRQGFAKTYEVVRLNL